MTGLWGEIRYAARMLLKRPVVSGIAVVTLGLGIGLTAVMFSIVYGAMLRGLPFENGGRILVVSRVDSEGDQDPMGVPPHDYLDWAEQQSSFDELAGYYEGTVNVRWADEPERFDGAFVSANLFRALGVQTQIGRTFREDEDDYGSPATAILSHRVWMDRFSGEAAVLGRVVGVNGEATEIIGVMPEGFRFPNTQEIWVPLRKDVRGTPRGAGIPLTVLGPLREGVSRGAAMVEMSGIMARLAAQYPETNDARIAPLMRPFTEQFVGPEGRTLLYTMLATVSLVLLIACANVANLLLARAAGRTREVGIRTAIGASRSRVIGQLVLEAFAISAVAAVLGVVVAWIGVSSFERAITPTNPPFFMVFRVDAPILAFIALTAAFSAIVAGGIPALKASGMDVSSILKDESRGSSGLRVGRLSRVLVVGELAMSLGLLVAAGLMTKSIARLGSYEYGFETDAVFTARLGLFEAEFPDTAARHGFYRDLQERIGAIPGARFAALSTVLPGVGSGGSLVTIEGMTYAEDRDHPFARSGVVGPGYFETVGVEIERGRDFDARDLSGALPVAIVNQSFAERHFPGGSALGSRFREGTADGTEPWRTIVGIVPDLHMEGMQNTESEKAGYYVPIEQGDARFMSILARGPAEPMALTEAVRSAVASVHPDTPLYFVQTLRSRIDEATWIFNIFGTLFLVFGGVALFLASVGLYGVMAFSVARRTPEVGIRLALGASRSQVLGMVLRQGLAQVALGLVLGTGLAQLVSRGMAVILFDVNPSDPLVFAGIATMLATTGVLASLIPARRASKADPALALRYD
ncbi:MAG TPA: ABC transporter permease [Longimicrobiales bacterium]|nr:ABC transporter permease [Longimicrobiales bacterium]